MLLLCMGLILGRLLHPEVQEYKAVNILNIVVVWEMEEKGQHVQSLGTAEAKTPH